MKNIIAISFVLLSLCAVSLVTSAERTGKSRKQPCPPTPLNKHDILGHPEEGCERVKLQDMELSLKMTLAEADRIQRQLPTDDWKQWIKQAQKDGASRIVTRTDQIVADRDAAVALGKMFFWEQRAGSDGQTACASCHYHAGADKHLGREKRNTSWGVAQNRMAVAQPAAEDGHEPSEQLELHHFLESYEFQWGGMIDFPTVLMGQAARAIERAQQETEGLALSAGQKQDVEASAAYLDQFRELVKPLRNLRSAVQAGPQPGADPGSFETVEVSLALAVEVATYAKQRREFPQKSAKDILESIQTTRDDIWSKSRKAEPSKSARKTELYIQRLLAPYEARLLLDELSPEKKDATRKSSYEVRKLLGRNSPSVINATLFNRLFHDGRATSIFNGYDHLGDEAGQDGYGKWMCDDGHLHRTLVRLPHSAAASQATAPLLSASEMSWFGRQYHHVARKLLDETPLQDQGVHPKDSVLGSYLTTSKSGGQKIAHTYREMIQRAFHQQWWCTANRLCVQERDAVTGESLYLTQMETNFSLFWGVAIQLYEETLISDQTPFDELMDLRRQGKPLPKDKKTQDILLGFDLFEAHACGDCHIMPELAGGTFATVFGPMLEFEGAFDAINAATEENEFVNWLERKKRPIAGDPRIESMPFRPHLAPRIYDAGYYNIGVTPDYPGMKGFDPGNGGQVRINLASDAEGLLSVRELFGSGLPVPLLERNPFLSYSLARREDERRSVSIGSFKAASLRNIADTKPYFHDGSAGELDDVLDHYANARFEEPLNRFIHPAMLGEGREKPEVEIPLTGRGVVIKFMESLTDPRVRDAKAPFDHPSLSIPKTATVDSKTGRTSKGHLHNIPATGM